MYSRIAHLRYAHRRASLKLFLKSCPNLSTMILMKAALMSWSTSTRKSRLPENWEALRLEVRDRAGGRCEYADANGRCPNIGNQCDHIIRGDDHSKANLQWLCTKHHAIKSSREGGSAKRRRFKRKSKLSSWNQEGHPGYA